MKYESLAICAAALLQLETVAAIADANSRPHLVVAAETREMIWNAVATDHGRVFVAGPRWTGTKGMSVALLDRDNHPRPYPDAAWNGWTPGTDTRSAFVSVNALRRDDHGGLWVIDTGAPDFGGNPCQVVPRRSALI